MEIKVKYLIYVAFVLWLAYCVFLGYRFLKPLVFILCFFGYEITSALFLKKVVKQ